MRSMTWLSILLALTATSGTVSAQVYSVPIRWCVIADDANGNGRVDPGEQGAPAFTNPGHVGEVDTDNVLWRRHERASDAVFIPEAQVTFRSAVYNIVESPTLRFPIIPDPLPDPDGAPHWLYGDVVHPDDSVSEWNAAHNACVQAWRDQHGVEDIGVVVINANHLRTLGNDSQPGVAITGGRRMLLRDNAYLLPGSPLNMFPALGDHVDKVFGHEIGHALGNLGHTCSDQNIMRTGRQDPNADGVIDNIHLSTGIAQGEHPSCSGSVNQVQAIRNAAKAAPGCKIAGTNTDCTIMSDVRTDRVRDAPLPFTDLSMFVASNEGATTRLVHEPMGPLDRRHLIAKRGHFVDYYSFIDQDQDATTGGSADSLGAPVRFAGAELATRVRVAIGPNGFTFVPTVWRFTAGRFQDVTSRLVQAFAFPLIAVSETRQTHLTDQITLTLPTALFGAGVTAFRVQAAVVSSTPDSVTLLDLLDEDRERPGRSYRWRAPTFPVCSVAPGAAPRRGPITVTSTGLLPNRPVHLIFGDRHVANGHAGPDGSVTITTAIPAGARDGQHLITVGTDGTALTADCVTTVKGGPRPGEGGDPGDGIGQGGGGLHEYAAKLVCGVQSDGKDMRLARGAYHTAVNVRNPGPDSVVFTKELALAYPPGGQRGGEVLRISEDRLLPGQALTTDCGDLRRRLFNGRLPAAHVDGFIVIRSPASLDVTGVYTVADLGWWGRPGSVRSVDVEPVAERRVRTDRPRE